MSEWNQYGLQDALSPIIEEFMFFHDYLLAAQLFITGSVVYIIVCLAQKRFLDTYLLEIHFLEVAWTVGPALFLVYIGVHSLSLLYSLDSSFRVYFILKTFGQQWYWSYKYSDFWTMKTSETVKDALKDALCFRIFLLILLVLFYILWYIGDSENVIPASPPVTSVHSQPNWPILLLSTGF